MWEDVNWFNEKVKVFVFMMEIIFLEKIIEVEDKKYFFWLNRRVIW